MRFLSLEVRNFRAIERFAVEDLTDFVMIAGQNGSGKSCVFDAIRLLKSFYGAIKSTNTCNGSENSRSTFKTETLFENCFATWTSPWLYPPQSN
ncbi:MAG: AAA family ATPase [Terriglobales bacterium]